MTLLTILQQCVLGYTLLAPIHSIVDGRHVHGAPSINPQDNPTKMGKPFKTGFGIQYEHRGASCDNGNGCKARPTMTAAAQPTNVTPPATGTGYGYNSYDPSRCIKCDHEWFFPPSHAKECKPSAYIDFAPYDADKSCCIIKEWKDYDRCTRGKDLKKCIILDNLVAEGPMVFNMAEKSFLGCRGTIIAPDVDPKLFKPKFIEYTAGKLSTFAGAGPGGCLIYMRGEAYFTGIQNPSSWRAIDIAKVDGLKVNGINIIQANAPNWHISGKNVEMENCNVIVTSKFGYPALSRNSDGFQIAVDNFKLSNSFIQSGDDAIALKRTNKAHFECLTIYYSHGLSIGSVSQGDVAQNVVFTKIELVGPEQGARIKAKKFELGLVSNVLFENILVHEANFTAIAIREDYLDPTPDHMPDTGVLIEKIKFKDFTATVKNRDSQWPTNSIMVLCSDGKRRNTGCRDFTFEDVSIKAADKAIYPPFVINYQLPEILHTSSGIDTKNVSHYRSTGQINKQPSPSSP